METSIDRSNFYGSAVILLFVKISQWTYVPDKKLRRDYDY